jgi:mono/diheme cytochrome c family protein
MKRVLVLIGLAALVAISSYAGFAQDRQPPQQYEQSMGGMMGGGSGMMSSQQSAWEAPSSAAGRQNPVPADRTSVAEGKALFDRYCASCHGARGKGNVGPDLAVPGVQSQTDGALFWKISQGRSPMPSFEDVLTAHQRWDLVNYIRTLAAAPKSTDAGSGGVTDPETTSTMQPGMGRGMMGSGMMQGGMGQGMMGGGMQGGMMGRGMGRGMMQGQGGMMGRGMMAQGGMGCPACVAMAAGLMHESVTPTSDGGVVVSVAGKLIKYDANLNKMNEVDLKIDWARVHRVAQQIMQNCPVQRRMMQQPQGQSQGQPTP